MEHRRPPLPVIILVLVIVVSLVGYFIYNALRPAANGGLTASGTVETTEISIAPELSGRVADVPVDEGDAVKAGDVLVRLDDTLLKAQRAVAAANVDTARAAAQAAEAGAASAQAQYDTALNTALTDDKANRATAWTQTKPADFNQPSWYFNKSEQIASVRAEMTAAQAALQDARENLEFVQEKSTSSTFVITE